MNRFLIALLALLGTASPAASDTPPRAAEGWGFENSDIPVDPNYRFGQLANGVRYIVRHNARPAGTGIVRMNVATGSLDEHAAEQGYAHFIEHMAFNGSSRIPEGEMVKLLERNGLAFGADTNASTSFRNTLYKLDLPRSDPALIDTAIMLMRETASNLTIAPDAVKRERGVILSEMRDRNSWEFRNAVDSTRFFYPGTRYAARFPIGKPETLDAATSNTLRTFYEREYVPAHVTLVIVGDFDVGAVEAAVVRQFGDWAGRPAERPPQAGPVRRKDTGRIAIHIDPALSERLTVQRNGTYLAEPDTVAQRQQNLLREISYDIVNRRLQRLSRQTDAPFRGAGFGTGDVFKAARSTRLIIDTVDGGWKTGLEAAAREYRRALEYGFSASEIAEQVARIRTALTNAAASADTRTNSALARAALALIDDETIPSTPASALSRFEHFSPQISASTVLAAMKQEALPLDKPLIRFEGRIALSGGARALRKAWHAAMRSPIAAPDDQAEIPFAYTDFGMPGSVVSDNREPSLGIRELRFANGVMLNLKNTGLESGKVRMSIAIDGGDMLKTRANPLATEMLPYLDEGGLAKHSRDALDTILAGHTLGFGLSRGGATFNASAQTTPRDLELQLQLLTALITDPGYRAEGEVQYRQSINTYFARLRATPASALEAELGAILSDNDPRFSLQPADDYRHLTYAKLQNAVGDRLAHGAIEIGIVGDIDEDRTIALVAATLGALPVREQSFRADHSRPVRPFSADRSRRVVRHTGPSDQALLRVVWPTRDDSDPDDALKLELLERIVRIVLTERLREALGKAYSPSATSFLSRVWKGYGTFSLSASIDVGDVPAAREAFAATVADLNASPVDGDMLLRARQPMIATLDNALKSNTGWLSLVDRAQTEADRIDRYQQARNRLLAITPDEIAGIARRYLSPGAGLEVLVLPQNTASGQ